MTVALEPEVTSAPPLSRNALMRLPTDVKERLRDIPRHLHALEVLLAETDEDRYVQAAGRGDVEALVTVVYPLQRVVDVLCGYVCDLAAVAVRRGGIQPGEPLDNLQLLPALGAASRAHAGELVTICGLRATLLRPQDEEEHRAFARAAVALERVVVPFLGEYTRWLSAQPPRVQ